MEWFKHMTSSHEDPDISDAWDIFGDAGPVVFWTLVEIYGKEFSKLDENDFLTLSLKFFERKLRRKWKSFGKILEFFQKRQRILFQKNEIDLSITIPKFIKLSSNWTRREHPKPTELPTEEPTELPTAIEVEVRSKKLELDNTISNESSALPSDEKNEDLIKTVNEIDELCQRLYETKKFVEAHKFRNKLIKEKKHPGAILHTLKRIRDSNNGIDPWKYGTYIIQVESQNYTEKDHFKKHEQIKKEEMRE